MDKKCIFFDLDGTLTDSGAGIINCACYALEQLGLSAPAKESMGFFVGPPLQDSFPKVGVPEDKIAKAVVLFRERYATIGKFENIPYPGIRDMLEALKVQGHRLFVATAKPEAWAVEILEYFELSSYFERICGASTDHSRYQKADVIAYLLRQIPDAENIVMVGDTVYDVLGAREHGIDTVGVAWGYGNIPEMMKAGAVAIANAPAQLLEILK